MTKIRVAILFGGRSTEHEISLLSARNIIRALPKEKYEPVLIGIDKKGKWHYHKDALSLFEGDNPIQIGIKDLSTPVLFSQNTDDHELLSKDSGRSIGKIDVIFPILHGTFGEDGAIQGLAKLANLPCVGPGILGSAIGMDKELMKRLLRDAGIESARFVTARPFNKDQYPYEKVSLALGNELFIKPVNLGSSVGISHVTNKEEYDKALDHAFLFDRKVLIEEKIVGRELECAVLGNDFPEVSVVGEIIPKNKWYSYEAKYLEADGAVLDIPANISNEDSERVRALSILVYQVLECSGMARIDFFMTPDKRLLVNEINTLPGFTNISMYPALWHYSGLSNEALVDKLITLAIASHTQFESLKKSI